MENFAKDTGDFIGLSKVDMLVISMGMQLARERGEIDLVRKVPRDLQEFRPENLKKAYDAFESDDSDESSNDEAVKEAGSSSEDDKEAAEDDDWNCVEETRQTKRTKKRL